MEPICAINLPAHHASVKMAKGGMVHIKAKPVTESVTESEQAHTMGMSQRPDVPLEKRYHVMSIESAEDPEEEKGESAAAEATEAKAPKKKAKTPAELIRQRRMGK